MNPDISEFRPLVHEAPLAVNEAQALALLPSLDHLGVALSPRPPPQAPSRRSSLKIQLSSPNLHALIRF